MFTAEWLKNATFCKNFLWKSTAVVKKQIDLMVTKSADAHNRVRCHYVSRICDPTIWQPGFNLPCQSWMLLNIGADSMGAIAPTAKKLWKDAPTVARTGILSCRHCAQRKCAVKITNVSL